MSASNMILNCITNWSTGNDTSKDQQKRDAETAHTRNYFKAPSISASHETASPRQLQVDWDDIGPPEAFEATKITLLGPPSHYFGKDRHDRYAYMMYEAIATLKRKGYSSNIAVLQTQYLAKKNRGTNKQHRRVPGILGFLLNDMAVNTQVAVFEPRTGKLAAHLGFRTYKQPWLYVCCRSEADAASIEALKNALARHFYLIKIAHESKTFSVPNCKAGGLEVKMTTGYAAGKASATRTQDDLYTKFVFEKDGEVVARALWSFANQSLDSVGPTMEVFESFGGNTDHGLVLATMEDKMIELVSPLVAFSLRMCRVNETGASKWLSRRGYKYSQTSKGKDVCCKAFVVF